MIKINKLELELGRSRWGNVMSSNNIGQCYKPYRATARTNWIISHKYE